MTQKYDLVVKNERSYVKNTYDSQKYYLNE